MINPKFFAAGDKKNLYVLGHGIVNDIYDLVYVDAKSFSRAKSPEVGIFNGQLKAMDRPYLLIGIGRWGTADPWLGIPVKREQISGAKVIIETNFKDMMVTPSQDSHFFHNLTSFTIGYFTINPFKNEGFIDWDWLDSQEKIEKKQYTRHVRLKEPLTIKMNGYNNTGIVLKPKNSKNESFF